MGIDELKEGDLIRFVSEPTEWSKDGYLISECTRKLWQRLIDRKRPVKIYLDGGGMPWVKVKAIEGTMFGDRIVTHHHLAIIENGGWVKVKRRK